MRNAAAKIPSMVWSTLGTNTQNLLKGIWKKKKKNGNFHTKNGNQKDISRKAPAMCFLRSTQMQFFFFFWMSRDIHTVFPSRDGKNFK